MKKYNKSELLLCLKEMGEKGFFVFRNELAASVEDRSILKICCKKKNRISTELTATHKTAHLQIAQANAQPKFAKELFSCQHSRVLL